MKKLITKKDLILLAIVLLCGIIGMFLMNSADTGKSVTITIDGKTKETISLDNDFNKELNGVSVCCENGEVYVNASDCSDKVCVRSGRISKSGESIICAPNRVAIKIEGKKGTLPDAMTG